MNTASPEELRRLERLHAAGFLDATLTELRYEDLVEEDHAALRAAAHSDRWKRPSTSRRNPPPSPAD